LTGPVVVSRGDPYIDPATGLCCINTKMESMNLWGFDPVCGTVHVTLNPSHPTTGTICAREKGTCFPALSCFNVFIRVEVIRPDGTTISYVNCDPIVMCCTIDKLPPFGCPYSILNPPVVLYKELATADVCALGNRPPPAAFIREAVHTPEPQPTCPPAPVVQTSSSSARLTVDTPLG